MCSVSFSFFVFVLHGFSRVCMWVCQEMAGVGMSGKLKPLVDTCQDPLTLFYASASLAQIQGHMDL